MKKKVPFLTVIVVSVLLLAAVFLFLKTKEYRELETGPELTGSGVTWAGWIPYWDAQDGLTELYSYDVMPSDVVAFAALFSLPHDDILILEPVGEILGHLAGIQRETRDVFLSYTNDVQKTDGTFIQKDREILWRLLGTDSATDVHIEKLIEVALSYGVDGIEIDYESIKDDTELWQRYCLFLDKLYHAASEKGLRLRAVLAWNSVDFVNFPPGPEYVVMCYNLYGTHSGPGPKADKDFLEKTFAKNSRLPGEVSMALANGGFDWSGGTCRAVTEKQAAELAALYKAQVFRDESSQALFFSYIDRDGISHDVWFADKATLYYWTGLAIGNEYTKITFWRFGGNDELLSLR
ncbi:MAG: hypothetical protein ACOWWO_12410 [Peptococcaceae bacterium]